ncbi:hypothetical protein JXA88_04590 [Candidatus Fermentibacteria bacterium]|nr:hypothetical protein [Candidatus Fermentibacteria bacterium]
MAASMTTVSAVIFGVAGIIVFLLAVNPGSTLRRASTGHRRFAGLVILLMFVAQAEHALVGWPVFAAVFETVGIVLAFIAALFLFLAKNAPSPH